MLLPALPMYAARDFKLRLHFSYGRQTGGALSAEQLTCPDRVKRCMTWLSETLFSQFEMHVRH